MTGNEPVQPTRVTKPVRDPAALTSEYHKAHKQLMLWSAILFIWELIGVDLDEAKKIEGTTGAIVRVLKSPQGIPIALALLVLYFLFKSSNEWSQCPAERKQNRYARRDYYSAVGVACLSLTLLIGQSIFHSQLLTLWKTHQSWSEYMLMSLVVFGFFTWSRDHSLRQTVLLMFSLVFGVALPSVIVNWVSASTTRWESLKYAGIVTLAIFTGTLFAVSFRYIRRHWPNFRILFQPWFRWLKKI
jgi:hypothetical protein